MATLLEIIGEGAYTSLLQAVASNTGNPVPVQTHPYASCPRRSRCPEHRRVYRRLLKATKQAVIKVTVTEQALLLLATAAPKLSDSALYDLCRVARLDPNPTRLPSQSAHTVVQTMARRALYLDGKG